MNQTSTQHRSVPTPQDAVNLLKERGVLAAAVWREGARRLSIDPHTLLDALTALPDEERLPPQLEELLETAKNNITRPQVSRGDRVTWEPLIGIGGAYLIGRSGDRRGALALLWTFHKRWEETREVN